MVETPRSGVRGQRSALSLPFAIGLIALSYDVTPSNDFQVERLRLPAAARTDREPSIAAAG
jgi:hypothetical protein